MVAEKDKDKGPTTGPVRSYATVASPREKQIAPASVEASKPLFTKRTNAFLVDCPTTSTKEAFMQAIAVQYPDLEGIMPLSIAGHPAIQALKNVAGEDDVIQVRIDGFYPGDGGSDLLKTELEKFGKVIEFKEGLYPNTKHFDSSAHVVRALTDPTKYPPSRIALIRTVSATSPGGKTDTYTENLITIITSQLPKTFCIFCHEADHTRQDCKVAPPCKSCGSRGHILSRCPVRHIAAPAPAPTAPPAGPAAKPIFVLQEGAFLQSFLW